MAWTADITNDPDRDYALCIELWEGDTHRATLYRASEGDLRLTLHPSDANAIEIPARWLAEVLSSAERDLTEASTAGTGETDRDP